MTPPPLAPASNPSAAARSPVWLIAGDASSVVHLMSRRALLHRHYATH
jgi:hypothetical protein